MNERSGKQVLLYLILEKVFPLWPWTVQAGFPALRIFSLTAQAAAATIETNNERAKLNHSLTTLGTMSLFPAERDANHPRCRSITIHTSFPYAEMTEKNAITGRMIHFESFFQA